MRLVVSHVIVFEKLMLDIDGQLLLTLCITLTTLYHFTTKLIMAEWHASFEGILALHQSRFVAASQKTRRTIVKTVRDNISAQNNSKDEPVELPKALKKV